MATSGLPSSILHLRRHNNMRARDFIVNEGWREDWYIKASCDKYQGYEVNLEFLKQFISDIKKNSIDNTFWNMIKKDWFYKGSMINCPNSSLTDQQRQLFKNLIDDIDMSIAHLPRRFLGGINNTDINISKELINKVEQLIKLVPAFFGHAS